MAAQPLYFNVRQRRSPKARSTHGQAMRVANITPQEPVKPARQFPSVGIMGRALHVLREAVANMTRRTRVIH